MNIIEIKGSNYQDYLRLNMVAFSFAYGGAMGEGGGIYIIDKDGQIYHTNYCENDGIDTIHIREILPVIEDIEFGVFGNKSNNDNWDSIYLGAGNHLVIDKNIYDGLIKKVEDAHFRYKSELFQYWPGFVLDLIGMDNNKLTMSDLWELIDNDK